MLLREQKEAAMPRGLYRDSGGWVHVNYEDRFEAAMHRSDYDEHDYKPSFESLPLREEYEKARAAKRRKLDS
jgi:hypothetical protein